tara:strand:+ start:11376 stop:11756 length:381 start_codon:yes stop_codon:yes gene_type:complete
MSKVKFTQEYIIKASPALLYNYISTPSGLSEWFADNVNSRGKRFTFHWDGEDQEAELVSKKTNSFVKFKWLNEEDEEETFFEMKIVVDELTKDVSLMVTDFADEDEVEEARMLWDSQIEELHHIIG